MSQPESLPQAPKTFADVLEEEIAAVHPNTELPGTRGRPEPARLKSIFHWLHAQQSGRSALCLSGGGIRSASFGLGVLQRLAKCGGLGHFDFLSTVSGGGYLGSWLSAWIKREGRDTVIGKLAEPPHESPLEPEWPTLRFLRAYSNYLAPRLGLLSADSWTLVATFLRNMLLNWLVLIPPLLAALMLPRFFLAAIYSEPPAGWEGAAWILAMLCAAASTAYAAADMPTAGNARWSEARFVCLRLLPMIASAHFAVLAWAWRYNALPDLLAKAIGLARPGWIETLAFVLVPGIVGGAVGGLIHRVSWTKGLRRLAAMVVPGALAAVALREIAFGWFSHPTQGFASINLAAFGAALLLALFLLLNFLVTGVSGRVTRDEDREWWGRSGGWMLAAILALAGQHAIVFWGPYGVEWLANFFASPGAALNALTGLLAAASAMAGGVSAVLGFSSGSSATEGPRSHAKRLTAGALLFFVLFDLLLSYCTHRLAGNYATFVFFIDGEWYSQTWRDYLPFLYAPALLLVGLAMSWFINVNRFSLHTMYRNRLIRAFLGASNTERGPHPFTGFDERDNLNMHELSAERPLHLINIALNLTRSRNLAWQERKAQSFTVTRLHSGSKEVGYQPTPFYGRGVKLGTAVTISGAAANPNSGYTSAPLVTLLMTLFNVRLGWWLPNPGAAGRGIWQEPAPRFAAGPLYAEALGLTSDRFPWVNLSDGGHFENLGLYEMVLRRCRSIVVIDGGQDSEYVFEDLGNAVRKIRIDLGISIEIDLRRISPKLEGESICCALGTIKYSAVDPGAPDGRFVYLKPLVTADVPADVRNYQSANKAFPHESTSDQFFSESQLESYRMLGWHAAGQIFGGDTARFDTLESFFQRVATYIAPPSQCGDGFQPATASVPPVTESAS